MDIYHFRYETGSGGHEDVFIPSDISNAIIFGKFGDLAERLIELYYRYKKYKSWEDEKPYTDLMENAKWTMTEGTGGKVLKYLVKGNTIPVNVKGNEEDFAQFNYGKTPVLFIVVAQ